MMHSKLLSTLLCGALLLAPRAATGQTATTIHSDYTQRIGQLKTDNARSAVAKATSPEAKAALEFLYAYMPLPDVADYAPQFYVDQVECALRARKELPWGTTVPEREWRHFVLPVRVNNEHLDAFRTTCYETLRDRVKDMTMYDAVLEVNHWCHEFVTYQPSDARTSPPLSSMRSAIGRCGEESTFTVAALRAVGIPARQVYTPRWAHTDDNHAWVEAWVDGKWYFLGACEPEPVLNLGWFNAPASRGMLMHTKVFGKYEGPEDVMLRTPCYTEINVTAGYARTAPATVRVVDPAGKTMAGVRVDFKVYNYAEFFTVLSTRTNANGEATITAGLGDLVAWASNGKLFGLARLTCGQDSVTTLVLSHNSGERFSLETDITPPQGENNLPRITTRQRAYNAGRLLREDSIRMAYVATFPDSGDVAAHLVKNGKLDTTAYARLLPLVRKSRGNSAAVYQLYRLHGTRALDLMETLTDKDLRDFDVAVADDHLLHTHYHAGDADELNYLLCPRITTEHLTPWRSYFQHTFRGKTLKRFGKQPQDIAAWIRHEIAVDSTWNPLRLWLAPESAHRMRQSDIRSMGVLFVAIARSAGVPARINAVDGRVEYLDADRRWQEVHFENGLEKEPAREATIKLDFTPRDGMENPKYYTHFTLSRMENGMPKLQEYPEEDDWQHHFAGGQSIPEGYYALTTGTRMADGGVLARLSFFPVATDGTATQTEPLIMRQDTTRVQVIGSFNSENLFYDESTKAVRSLLSVTGRGYYALALVRAGHEPSNHILHDLERAAADLEKWDRPILVLFPSREELQQFKRQMGEFAHLPATIHLGVDENATCLSDLTGSGLIHSAELPVVIIADTFNRVVLRTQGYTIGIGERLARTAKQIE